MLFAESAFEESDVAGALRCCLAAVAEGVIRLGQEPICRDDPELGPSSDLGCIDREVSAPAGYSARSTTAAAPAVFFTDSTPFFAAAFDSYASPTAMISPLLPALQPEPERATPVLVDFELAVHCDLPFAVILNAGRSRLGSESPRFGGGLPRWSATAYQPASAAATAAGYPIPRHGRPG
jgi:hypothetical protein